MHHVCWSVFPFYVLFQRMYMEPNDPKETAEDTFLPDPEREADWQDAGFEGYPLEEGDD